MLSPKAEGKPKSFQANILQPSVLPPDFPFSLQAIHLQAADLVQCLHCTFWRSCLLSGGCMSFKLGEILVKEQMITSSQLEEALKYQVLYGGKIGINLIEMGFIKEEDIARMLSRKFNLPFIEPEKLNYIPAEVIAQIPAELAARHSVVPIALERKRLTVAMANPTDLEVVDEMAFRTGFVILPVVTPELSLTHALKKYYKIERELRPAPEKIEIVENQVRYVETVPESHPVSDATSVPGVNETKNETESHLKLVEKNTKVSPQPCEDGILSLEVASKGLANIACRNDVATILTRFASQMFKRTALFMIRGESALGWVAIVEEKVVKNFDEFQIPLEDPSILKALVDSKKSYVGPVPFSLLNSRIISSFGGTFQDTAFLVPLNILGRVVAVLYVDGENTHSKEYLVELQQLVSKAAMALEILILKKKILML